MEIIIKNIPEEQSINCVEIFTEAFVDDPLFLFAFPEKHQREKLTKVMYEFVVSDMVPILNLTLKGAFADETLTGCMIYSTPETNAWDGRMNEAIEKMRHKANDPAINLIGEYAMLRGLEINEEHFYGNELAVKKQFRKKGIGRALINGIINHSETHPLSKGILIDTANPDNAGMYEKFGWHLKSVKDFYTIKKIFMWRENIKP